MLLKAGWGANRLPAKALPPHTQHCFGNMQQVIAVIHSSHGRMKFGFTSCAQSRRPRAGMGEEVAREGGKVSCDGDQVRHMSGNERKHPSPLPQHSNDFEQTRLLPA